MQRALDLAFERCTTQQAGHWKGMEGPWDQVIMWQWKINEHV